jgi:tight adherence protein C
VTWVAAVGYAVAADLLVLALVVRSEPRVLAGLDIDPPPERRWFRDRRVLAGTGLGLGASAAVVDPATALLVAPVLAVAGYRLPAFLRARADARRRAAASRSVPDMLDVVAVSVTAGLSPRLALERAADAVGGPLGEELSTIRRDVDLGGTWRAGLRDATLRLAIPELRRLAAVLELGRRLGVPVVARLRDLAREVRSERRARREERARRAPVTMLFPLVFLILPAFVLAAVVPAVLVAVRGVQ